MVFQQNSPFQREINVISLTCIFPRKNKMQHLQAVVDLLEVTAIYLNFVLLHKADINSLKKWPQMTCCCKGTCHSREKEAVIWFNFLPFLFSSIKWEHFTLIPQRQLIWLHQIHFPEATDSLSKDFLHITKFSKELNPCFKCWETVTTNSNTENINCNTQVLLYSF